LSTIWAAPIADPDRQQTVTSLWQAQPRRHTAATLNAMTSLMPSACVGLTVPELFLQPADGDSRTLHERCAGNAGLIILGAEESLIAAACHHLPHAVVIGLGLQSSAHPFPVLADEGPLITRFLHHLGAATLTLPVALTLAPDLRVLEAIESVTAEDIRALQFPEPPRGQLRSAGAPLLIVDQVLPASLCQALIAQHERDHSESGMVRYQDGVQRLVPDAALKQRADHALRDPALSMAVMEALQQRLFPRVAQALLLSVGQMEAFKVVSYHGHQQGHFALHRDNTSPGTGHRKLALSLLLSDDYDGGELVFPEFGPDRYRPAAGAAVVFSGSLLHGVRPVTRGRRDVLLSFLW
jgi:predicted 2-oxoglutarate/Fe(II)-dependent dioxygenase YbiX